MIFIHIRLKINQVGPTGGSPKNVLSKKSFKKSYTVTINPFVCISLIFVSKVNPLKMKNGITNCFTSETQNLPPPSQFLIYVKSLIGRRKEACGMSK